MRLISNGLKKSNRKRKKTRIKMTSIIKLQTIEFPRYPPEFYEQRTKVIIRDGRKCINCGKNRKLVVHHKNHNIFDNSLKNLVTLCRKCHYKIPNKKRDYVFEEKGKQYTLTMPSALMRILKWQKKDELIIELANDRKGMIITKVEG